MRISFTGAGVCSATRFILVIVYLCYPDKTQKPVSMNIKLRLMEHGEVEEGSPSLELIVEKEQEEEKLSGKQQDCTQTSEDDRTSTCSADSNTGPDQNP